jgi:hypothetical protein
MAWETVWERAFADEDGERYYCVKRTSSLKQAKDELYVKSGGNPFDDACADFAEKHFGSKRPKYFYSTANCGMFTTKKEALAFEKECMRECQEELTGETLKRRRWKVAKAGK